MLLAMCFQLHGTAMTQVLQCMQPYTPLRPVSSHCQPKHERCGAVTSHAAPEVSVAPMQLVLVLAPREPQPCRQPSD